MAYIYVNQNPVFLTRARHHELEGIVSKGKSDHWIISSKVSGTKEVSEKIGLMYGVLNEKFRNSPETFNTEWGSFTLKDKEAFENVWELLYDYCNIYGYSFLSDSREFSEILEADYKGESGTYPMGRCFTLNHLVKPNRWWWRFLHNMTGRIIQVQINTSKVRRIMGNLQEFEIHFAGHKLVCGKKMEVLGTL